MTLPRRVFVSYSLLTDPQVASACKRRSHELKANSALDRTCELLEELG